MTQQTDNERFTNTNLAASNGRSAMIFINAAIERGTHCDDVIRDGFAVEVEEAY